MGIPDEAVLRDQENRPHKASDGEPLLELFA
jgi:hypothetical protein